jgi:hypothetical protein
MASTCFHLGELPSVTVKKSYKFWLDWYSYWNKDFQNYESKAQNLNQPFFRGFCWFLYLYLY